MPANKFFHHGSAPEEHARVPIEVAVVHKFLCRPRIRLLAKARYRRRLQTAALDVLREFDVAVSGFRPSWPHTQDHHAGSFRRLVSCSHKLAKPRLLEY